MDGKFHPNYRMSKINIWEDWDKLCKRYKKLRRHNLLILNYVKEILC